ncbi:MAG TPA: universal stress protein [Gemmatimonadaceae bacterium]
MSTMDRMVVGVDFTPSSEAAVAWAARHFAPGAELMLVHVMEMPEPPGFLREPFPEVETLVDEREAEAARRLEALAASITGARVTTRVVRGRAAEQLLAAARDAHAGLVVVGPHAGERGGVWARLGSTAEALVRASSVPVLVARGRLDRAPRHLLVAVDYDEVAEEVLRWASRLARQFDASVTAVHVMSNAVLSHVLSLEAVKTGKKHFTDDEIRARFRDEAEQWMDRVMAAAIDRDRTQTTIEFGDAAATIVGAATRGDSDLIVLGRRGKRPLRRLLLGGVVREILRTAPCPVLVVVEPGSEADQAGPPDQ